MTLRQQTSRAGVQGLTFCLLGALALARPGYAQVWDFVPDVALRMQYLDNPRLVENPGEDSARTTLDTRVLISRTGKGGEVTFAPRVRLDRYAESAYEDLDTNDVFLPAGGSYRWQNYSAGFRSMLSRQSVRNSEILEAIPEDPDVEGPDEGESGTLVLLDENQRRRYFSPYVDFELSDRTSLLVELRLDDVAYSGPQVISRTDYEASALSAGIVREVGARTFISATLFGRTYEAEQFANETDSVGVQGAITRSLSDTWTLDLGIGVQRTDISIVVERDVIDMNGVSTIVPTVVDVSDTTRTYNLGLTRRKEPNSLNFSVGRSLAPNSSGFLSEREQLRFYAGRELTSRLTGQVGIRILETKTVGDPRQDAHRKDTRLDLRFSWVISRLLSMDFGVSSTTRDFTDQAGRQDADSNVIYVGIRYRGEAGTR